MSFGSLYPRICYWTQEYLSGARDARARTEVKLNSYALALSTPHLGVGWEVSSCKHLTEITCIKAKDASSMPLLETSRCHCACAFSLLATNKAKKSDERQLTIAGMYSMPASKQACPSPGWSPNV